MKRPKGIHTNGVDTLVNRILEDKPALLHIEHKYKIPNGEFGEIDIYYGRLINGHHKMVAIEYKSNDSPRNYLKAVQQLIKDEKYLKFRYHPYKIWLFYATPTCIKKVGGKRK